MQTNTIILVLLLAASFSNGGVVKEKHPKPFEDVKDFLSMKGAADAIKRSFNRTGEELDDLAKRIEDEIDEVALYAFTNQTDTEKVIEALDEALNIQNLLFDLRSEFSGLARQTIRKSERINKKLMETLYGKRRLNMGMRSMLRDMKSLLSFSERKLKEAKKVIRPLREEVNKVGTKLRIFKVLIQLVEQREAEVQRAEDANDVAEILRRLLQRIREGVNSLALYPYPTEYEVRISGIIKSLMEHINTLAARIFKIISREDILPIITREISRATDAMAQVTTTATNVTSLGNAIEAEVELIIEWKDAFTSVYRNIDFNVNEDLEDGKDQYMELYKKIKNTIENEDDVKDIKKEFNDFKDAAQNYLNHVTEICPSCAE